MECPNNVGADVSLDSTVTTGRAVSSLYADLLETLEREYGKRALGAGELLVLLGHLAAIEEAYATAEPM